MIEAPQITTQQIRDAIIARHNEEMQDCNPDFIDHTINKQGREVHVKFKYFKALEWNGEFTYNYKNFDGRIWS